MNLVRDSYENLFSFFLLKLSAFCGTIILLGGTNMEKNFFNKRDYHRSTIYENPVIITMTGVPGSGKSLLSRTLSSAFRLYLLSNDYVRNYLLQECEGIDLSEVQSKVRQINNLRLAKLLLGRVSVVMDASLDDVNQLKKLEMLCKILRYNLIKVKIEAYNDSVNIQRIQRRVMDYDKKFEGVLGDSAMYSTSYSEEEYYAILARKQTGSPISDFDYVIQNSDNDVEALQNQVNELVDGINEGLVLKRNFYLSYF